MFVSHSIWWDRYELPTWLVAVAIYSCWIFLTLNHELIPSWVLFLLGGYVVCWHGSLQHEALHGHPTRIKAVNTALVIAPLSLWVPYKRYRQTHLAHHKTDHLTDPYDDPESFYCSESTWSQLSRWRQHLRIFTNTLAGRLLLGPTIVCIEFWRKEIKMAWSGDWNLIRVWIEHLLLSALLLFWVLTICEIPLWKYIVCFAYPGLSLTLLRSFAEHRAAQNAIQRTALVKSGWLGQLLYLNNNLHCVHHNNPALSWHKIPARYESTVQSYSGLDTSMYYSGGYWEIIKTYLFKPVIQATHPIASVATHR